MTTKYFAVTTYVEAESFADAVDILTAAPDDYIYSVTDETNGTVTVDPTGTDDLKAEVLGEGSPEPGERPTITARPS